MIFKMAPEIICFPRWRLVYLHQFCRTPELIVVNGDIEGGGEDEYDDEGSDEGDDEGNDEG